MQGSGGLEIIGDLSQTLPAPVRIIREVPIVRSPRVLQVEGLFDVPPSDKSREEWVVGLPIPAEWNVGLIAGPSGSGKTTIAKEFWPGDFVGEWGWPDDRSFLDGFPKDLSIKDIVELLSSVGFSSPPSWLRPYHVLSNGEKFRAFLARTLAEMPDLAVVDEFTSVVDRTVAKIGSAAVAKTVRRRGQKFIAISCHLDILEWLEPDWVYMPHAGQFYSGRYLHRRPPIELTVKRVHTGAWKIFRKHHYLDTELHKAARCFVAYWENQPVAFTAVLHFPHPHDATIKREHRTVCLPDFQGVGIGNAMSDYVGSIVRGMGFRFMSQTSHPAMVRARARSENWKMIAKPNATSKAIPKGREGLGHARGDYDLPMRLRATFEYVGPIMPREQAQAIWE